MKTETNRPNRFSNIGVLQFIQWRNGQPQATQRMWAVFESKFLYVAASILRNHHDAEDAFSIAFNKLDVAVREGRVTWKGEGRLCALMRQMVRNAALDMIGQPPRPNEDDDLEDPSSPEIKLYAENPALLDDKSIRDPLEEEIERSRNMVLAKAWSAYRDDFNERDQRFLVAYEAMAAVPGSHQWGKHRVNGFLKEQLKDLGLSDGAFYTALNRFKAKVRPFLESWGLWHEGDSPQP